jgi:large subunit ribosomal protein L29
MKMQEIKEMTQDEVEIQLQDMLDELYNLRFQHAMHQLDNPIRLRDVKKDIARLRTVLHEYELGLREDKAN